MPGMMSSHRGKTVYIPIIMPETWQLAVAFILCFIAGIMLIVSAATTDWRHQKLEIHDGDVENNPWMNISVAIDYGLRSMHVQLCLHGDGFINTQSECSYEDVLYRTCGTTNTWCSRADNTGPYIMVGLLACGVGALVAVLSQCLKRFMHFAWISCVMAATPFMVIAADQIPRRVRPSAHFAEFMQMAYIRDVKGKSLAIGIVAEMVLLVALALMLWDLWIGVKEIQAANTAEGRQAELESGAADATRNGRSGADLERPPMHSDV